MINGTVAHRLLINKYYGGSIMTRDLKNFFVSNNLSIGFITNEVTFDTAELRKLITNSLKHREWTPKDFLEFLELVGVKTPVKISKLADANLSFKCYSAGQKEILISNFNTSEIQVTEGDESRFYAINEKQEGLPLVTLHNCVIKRNGKTLKSFFSNYFFHKSLRLDNLHTLEIEIDAPHNKRYEHLVLRNRTAIDNYLLSLDSSLSMSKVYDTIMQLIGFSRADFLRCKSISIVYLEMMDDYTNVISKIVQNYGREMEYVFLKKGEVFYISRDGSWRYFSGNKTLLYNKKKDCYNFFVSAMSEEDRNKIEISELISRVQKEISTLWKFVN